MNWEKELFVRGGYIYFFVNVYGVRIILVEFFEGCVFFVGEVIYLGVNFCL